MQYKDVFEKFEKEIRGCKKPMGLIQVGAHLGQEMPRFSEWFEKIILIEPIEKYADILRAKGYDVREVAISEARGNIDFYVSKRLSQFSSILPGGLLGEDFDKIKVLSTPLRAIQGIGYNVLVIDVQGAAMQVLRSADLNFEIIIFEGSNKPRYEGEYPAGEILEYLYKNGYTLSGQFQHGNKDVFDFVLRKNEKI